jgi:dephospho-CoA kinase
MIKVGLTGGIGSGKSLISKIFNTFSVPVYDSDYETKLLYQADELLKFELIRNFGKEVYLSDGRINREYLGGIVFQDKKKLNELNQLVHPRVKIHFEKWLQNLINFKYIIKESAILFESGAYKQVDKIILVTAPDQVRIRRVIERDSVTESSVLERMNNQFRQNELVNKANFIINNDGQKAILPQVYSIHQKLLSLS